ncbi:carboxypeptidase-like regulatory domain-containing protein [Hymenobacter sp. GOD-10R]|uniref:carboxypeptidase-like regulatory domain-containing protein n=1 Tax=Hymenobacter sp. GOD-10R TaxID=3093922 RepID=UPI002D76C416|nr:carboxypeptidase-like regulatory domain-containing protein [Hymenobacter sp. GOD-10R]WRQ28431.1 carboxypeptidase-like regulatory domain-containing protein [Hymenobacter sp. GOD-10R]
MTPTAHGRHCASCAKVVVDFTQFTDAELLVWLHQQAGQPTCGRFRADQLERELRPAAAPRPTSWRAWLAAAVAVWGLREAAASTAKAQAPTERREREGEPISIVDYVRQPIVIRGVVTDSTSHDLLPGVTVLLEGTNAGAATNENGQFELSIPADVWASSSRQLVIISIGYIKRTMPVATIPMQPLTLTLAIDTRPLVGELIVVGGYYFRPWYSPVSLWQRLKHPFRR